MVKTTKPEVVEGEVVDRPPLYDPAVHTDPKQVVFAELYCLCGGIWRQRDDVATLREWVANWIGRHTGDGHGAASKAAAVDERESRKEAAMRARGRGDQYRRKDYLNLDTTDTTVRPWPAFPQES